MKTLSRWFAVVAAVLMLEVAKAPADAPVWKAGVARVDITPAAPMWMAGYASRKHPSEGVALPLWGKALAVEDAAGHRAVLITTDLIGFERAFTDELARRVQQTTGIERSGMVLNCSHTHCGPVLKDVARVAYDLPPDEMQRVAAYRATLLDKLVRAVEQAVKSLQPARLAFGEGQATFGCNRRKPTDKGYVNSPYPEGPVDHVVPVLTVRDASDRLLAILFGYACHNTTLGYYQFNGDYAGYAQQALQEHFPQATALFMIGCGADTNPNPRGTQELAQQHGTALAAGVEKAINGPLHPLGGPLKTAFARVDLPLVTPPDKLKLESQLKSKNVYEQRLAQESLAKLARGEKLPEAYPCPLQTIAFGGDLTLVALSGETCVDYALRLRKELPGRRLWIAGYSNEVFAYIPSERVLREGGYEGGGAMVYFGLHGPFQPGLEAKIIDTVKRLVK